MVDWVPHGLGLVPEAVNSDVGGESGCGLEVHREASGRGWLYGVPSAVGSAVRIGGCVAGEQGG